ncbi:MAG TPA: gamma-glutamyl-gamma-aminobutyrate hydrolase family protein [Bacillota bacterium]|nr:gamma-glutamyl-gamma-aminobutyrate hydrolase family protein [Bacillota bacterium]
MRPLILVSADCDIESSDSFKLQADYVRAVYLAGGLPLVAVPPMECCDTAEAVAELCSLARGIVLTGGSDVLPGLFGEEPHPKLGAVNPVRDRFELALARAAMQADLPVLAICRGMQVLNVAAGGGLVQDIESCVPGAHAHRVTAPRWLPTHSVSVVPGSILWKIFRRDSIMVNSFHHQAVHPVAPGFEVSARASDGVVEAIEKAGSRFMVGVQWHPEALAGKDPEALNVFREFLIAAQGVY